MEERPTEATDVRMPGIVPSTWLDYADERGLPRDVILTEADLVREEAENFVSGVPLLKLAMLAQAVIRRVDVPSIGIDIGWRMPLTSFGNVGRAMLSSATFLEALQVCQRFWQLVGPDLILHVAMHEGLVVATISTLPTVQGQFRRVTIDAAMATFYRGVQTLLSDAVDRTEIWFDYPAPEHAEEIRKRIPVARFGMPIAQCRVPIELLQHKLPLASAVGRRSAMQLCEIEERTAGLQDRLSGRVQMRLGFDASGYPTLEQTAAAFHMTERTLRRRLQDEGTTYSGLLDEARRRDAVRLLWNPELDVADIAERLGYSDGANFTRAFRKWTGVAPSHFRAMQTGG